MPVLSNVKLQNMSICVQIKTVVTDVYMSKMWGLLSVKCRLYDKTVIYVFYCLSGIVNSCKIGVFHFEWEEKTLSNSKFRFEIW